MQKFLMRSASPGPLISTAGNPSLCFGFTTANYSVSLPFKKAKRKGNTFLPFGSDNQNLSKLHLSMAMATAATAFHGGGSCAFADFLVQRKPKSCVAASMSSRFFAAASGNYHSCGCSSDYRTPPRAWVVFKSAWLHTGSDGFVAAAAAAAAVEDMKNAEESFADGSGKDDGEDKGGLEEKTIRLSRRQNGSSSCGDLSGNPDLLTIPGVGPRNLRKLVEKGIGGVAELKQLYKDKFSRNSSGKMVEFLQSSVGIIHKNHAESITSFIKERVDEEVMDAESDAKPATKKRLTFCVEGNISVGKTTFLHRIANETLELRDLVEVVPEPINKWQDVGPDHFNVLDAFYTEPQRYAYTFQNYVFVTRVMQEKESSGGVKPLRLMERSVFSDRMVFVRAVHEANWMNEMEISIYDSWFDPVVSCLPGLIPDAFIYLRASPDTCHRRMKLRKRNEEGGVSLEYLRDLHEKHESWLFPFQSGAHGVLSVKPPLDMDNSLHPDIRDRIFYLEGDHMHSSIQKVPALVLDCEPNIDFSKDIEAKRQYARQVAEFFEFVKKKQEVPSAQGGKEGADSSQQPLLLPHQGGLWFPNGKHFPDSALKSLDFRQAMSLTSG